MMKLSYTKLAYQRGGYRERYAMEHGLMDVTKENGHRLLVFSYDENDPYQDANGATYDCTEGRWIC